MLAQGEALSVTLSNLEKQAKNVENERPKFLLGKNDRKDNEIRVQWKNFVTVVLQSTLHQSMR